MMDFLRTIKPYVHEVASFKKSIVKFFTDLL